jgi:hypothetical protein
MLMDLKPTYILFTLFEGQIEKIYGPVFQAEIESARKTQFEGYDIVEELPEPMFKILHTDTYFSDKRENWIEYLGAHLDSFSEFLPGFELDYLEKCIASEYFCIWQDLENPALLTISLSLSANPVMTGLVCFNLQKYASDTFDLELSTAPFYFSPSADAYFTKQDAILRFNQERRGVYISQN